MKRGQVALEFIMTYGWALLVILVMIGALAYFGVMNPSKLLPSKCQAGSELTCEDYQILEGGAVTLRLKQGVGKTIYIQDVACAYNGVAQTASTFDSVAMPGNVAWSPKDAKDLNCTMAAFTGLEGEKVKISYEVHYKKSTGGFTHLVEGDLYTSVRKP